MLPAAMRPRAALFALLALAIVALAGFVAGCGDEATSEVGEGEPIELAGLDYTVQITRFLNPDDTEDSGYLVGQPTLKPGNAYLGVFLTIENSSDDARPSATDFKVIDTLHNEYTPAESASPYALDIGTEVPPHGNIPLVDTTAQVGPVQGSLLIFPVSNDVSDNRPLKLEISTFAGSGEVILDI
jgi:hypothetical protein